MSMHFSDWKKLQRGCGMFNISQSFVAEGISIQDFEKIVHTFIPFVKRELNIKELPNIHFIDNPKFATRIAAFDQIKNNRIVIDIQGRQTMDILRTLAYDLIPYRQHRIRVTGSGHMGAQTENEANRLAGTIVRKFGEKHSGLFALLSVNESKKKKRKNNNIDYEHYPMELT